MVVAVTMEVDIHVLVVIYGSKFTSHSHFGLQIPLFMCCCCYHGGTSVCIPIDSLILLCCNDFEVAFSIYSKSKY